MGGRRPPLWWRRWCSRFSEVCVGFFSCFGRLLRFAFPPRVRHAPRRRRCHLRPLLPPFGGRRLLRGRRRLRAARRPRRRRRPSPLRLRRVRARLPVLVSSPRRGPRRFSLPLLALGRRRRPSHRHFGAVVVGRRDRRPPHRAPRLPLRRPRLGGGLVGFVSSACPPALIPSPSPARCFSGQGVPALGRGAHWRWPLA